METDLLGRLPLFQAVDRALLAKGWHIGYHRVSNMYGCQASVELLRAYQDYVEREFQLNLRPVLFGFSRGGLYAVNYATAYPFRVGGLYLDAPVLDVRSWPGGFGGGVGDPGCWEECKRWYGLTDATAPGFAQNPLDQAERLAHTGLPIISVVGLADDVVPYAENMQLFIPRYRTAGGRIEVIEKPGCGHHPHSLENPAPVVELNAIVWIRSVRYEKGRHCADCCAGSGGDPRHRRCQRL